MISAVHAGSSRSLLLARFAEARRRTDALFAMVPPSRMLERPIAERHRFAFYLGHLEAFERNLLGGRGDGQGSASELDALFAFGIDPLGGNLPSEAASEWPDIARIRAYNQDVRRSLDELLPHALDAERFGEPSRDGAPGTAFLMDVAIEHRLMHAETLAYMINQSAAPRRIRRTTPVAPVIRNQDLVRIPAGAATLGIDRDARTFAWDNEHDAHRVAVPEFGISRCMVSNGEYLAFVEAGGYAARECWTDADWQWREDQGVTHPAFWVHLDRRWYYRSLTELIPLPLDWPVYVSHAEASAYARWAGLALPTEAQWHRAAYGVPDAAGRAGVERAYPWGAAAPDARRGNFDFRSWEPRSVDAHADGDSAFGVRGMLGNGWEWTSTPFAPFPGFRAFAFYAGYSADFFDGRHYVVKGGSALTAAPLLRRSFRNWFQPHYPYVYAGFRCVAN